VFNGLATVHAVSRRPLTAQDCVQSQSSPHIFVVGQFGTGALEHFLSRRFSFPLSVSFHRCSTLIFFCMLLLPEGQTGKVWELANNNGFRKLVYIVQKITFT